MEDFESSFRIRCVRRPQPAIQMLGSVANTPVQALRVKNGCRQRALSLRLHYTVKKPSWHVPHLMSSPRPNLSLPVSPAAGDIRGEGVHLHHKRHVWNHVALTVQLVFFSSVDHHSHVVTSLRQPRHPVSCYSHAHSSLTP